YSIATATTSTVTDAAPVISVSIAGTAQEGVTLTAVVSGFEIEDTLSYQWQSGAVNIGSATGSTYPVVAGDHTQSIAVVATATPRSSDLSTIASAATGTVTDAAPVISVSIAGSAREGVTLTANVSGYDGDDTLSYQWQSNGTNVGTG